VKTYSIPHGAPSKVCPRCGRYITIIDFRQLDRIAATVVAGVLRAPLHRPLCEKQRKERA